MTLPAHGLRLAAVLLGLTILGMAAFASARMYWAEQLAAKATEEDLRRAVRLTPSNSDAWAQLGALLEKRGDTAAAAQALLRAVELNRYDAAAWVELGLYWELEGNPERAEQCLREAVRVDGTFYPRWALANFYLRQGGGESFWAAMRAAISHNRADLSAAFELYWRAFDSPDEILEKGIPDLPEVNRRYCDFLLQAKERTPAMAGVWRRLADRLQPADLQLGTRYLEALLAERQVEDAVRVWNQLCQAGLLPYQTLDPAGGRLLTNGKFLLPPSAVPFDWKLAQAEGISSDLTTFGNQSSLCIRFSGTHSEATELVSQTAPALERKTYRLTYRYSTAGLPPDTGLYWTVENAAGGQKLLASHPLGAVAEGWKQDSATFQTANGSRLLRLVFGYRRSPGTTRTQGSVCLTDVELLPVEWRSQQ